MNRKQYRDQQTQRTPLHIEARRLGVANLTTLVRGTYPNAISLRTAWDYRAAGLTVDQARKTIDSCAAWAQKQRRYSQQHPFPDEEASNRYLRLLYTVVSVRADQTRLVQRIDNIPLASSESTPTWDHYQVRITVAGRTLITQYHEEVDWGDRKNPKWPAYSHRIYTTYLLPVDFASPLPAKTIVDKRLYLPLRVSDLAEKSFTHDLRGHWWKKVITELVSAEVAQQYRWEPLPSTVYKIVEQNGHLRSVYNPDFAYPLGEWITDPAEPDHAGGIYAYRSYGQAIEAARNNTIFSQEWAEGKTLILCECEAKGRRIEYDNNKIAFSKLKIVRILETVSLQ